MRMVSRFLLVLLLHATVFPLQRPVETTHPEASRPTTTVWHVAPSFKFDALCFLNILTGDPFYLSYYQDEYKRFEPLLTPSARLALAGLKRKVKDDNKTIISAFLALLFSATGDQTLDDMLRTLADSRKMQTGLKSTPYYTESSWRLYQSVRPELKTIFNFLKEIRFEDYWEQNVLPKVKQRIEQVRKELTRYDVVAEVEKYRGRALPSKQITVYMLYFSHPHGIKITGTRYLSNVRWSHRIVLQNAVHELFHPPYDLARDRELKEILSRLQKDSFLMDKVLNHNPDFGYNSFEGFIEEDCVRALEQMASESLGIATDARRRWREEDGGMHVFAVALYSIMKTENYNQRKEMFRDFLIRNIKSGKLSAGKIKPLYDDFYSLQGRTPSNAFASSPRFPSTRYRKELRSENR